MIPPPVEGEMRLAAEADHKLLTAWLTEFNAEALRQTSQHSAMQAFAERWIVRQGRTMYLWVVAGRPVSMVGVSEETPNGIRVASVYTPRALRGRGYASALTAAVTQEHLDNGKRYCFLFTDLANPTLNHNLPSDRLSAGERRGRLSVRADELGQLIASQPAAAAKLTV